MQEKLSVTCHCSLTLLSKVRFLERITMAAVCISCCSSLLKFASLLIIKKMKEYFAEA